MYKAILIIQKIRTSTGIQSRPSWGSLFARCLLLERREFCNCDRAFEHTDRTEAVVQEECLYFVRNRTEEGKRFIRRIENCIWSWVDDSWPRRSHGFLSTMMPTFIVVSYSWEWRLGTGHFLISSVLSRSSSANRLHSSGRRRHYGSWVRRMLQLNAIRKLSIVTIPWSERQSWNELSSSSRLRSTKTPWMILIRCWLMMEVTPRPSTSRDLFNRSKVFIRVILRKPLGCFAIVWVSNQAQ
jgi:hypothetical protein